MKSIGVAAACVLAAGLAGAEAELGLHPDLTLASQYMAHGFNINGEHASLQPSLHVETKVPGLQLAVWAGLPTDRDFEASDEYDFLVKYATTLNAGERWAVRVNGYVDYWIYPNTENAGEVDPATGAVVNELEGWKFNGGFALPELLPLGSAKLVPSYNYYYWTPRDAGVFVEGGVHELGLAYALPVAEKQTLDLSSTVNYHDGVFDVDPGWSHATASLSTTFRVAGLRVSPGVNYQWTFEDTVNEEDEFWGQLSVARDF